MSSTTLKIIQGLAQAASNVYDGAHDERYSSDGTARKAGLSREEGDPILDKRVIDGFSVSFYGNMMCIKYQSDILLRDVYANDFENEINRKLEEIKKFLQKEYKVITGESVSLSPEGESNILVQSTSRVRSFVQAKQHYSISKIDSEPILSSSEREIDSKIRDFLSQSSTKRPKTTHVNKETVEMKLTRETLKQIIKEELETVTNEAYDIGPMGAIEPRDEKPSVDPEEIGADPAAPDFEEAVAQLSEKYPSVSDEMLRAMVTDMFIVMGAEGY